MIPIRLAATPPKTGATTFCRPLQAHVSSLLLTILFLPAIGFCQAWVEDKGEGVVSLTYQTVNFKGHYGEDGTKYPELFPLRTHSLTWELDYGLTPKLTLNVSLPYVTSKFKGDQQTIDENRALFDQLQQEAGGIYQHGFIDDGSYHGFIQDFRINARYNITSRPLMITPFVAFGVPSHDYPYIGESAAGRNLKELTIGYSMGRILGPFLPRVYLQAQHSYAFVQKADGVSTNHTNISLEGGYILTRRLVVSGVGYYQQTNGGLHVPGDFTTPQLILTHDRLLKASFWHLGTGALFRVNRRLSITGEFVSFISGSNAHFGSGFSFSMNWRFTHRRRRYSGDTASARLRERPRRYRGFTPTELASKP